MIHVDDTSAVRLAAMMRSALTLTGGDLPLGAALALGASVHLAVACGLTVEPMVEALRDLYASAERTARAEGAS